MSLHDRKPGEEEPPDADPQAHRRRLTDLLDGSEAANDASRASSAMSRLASTRMATGMLQHPGARHEERNKEIKRRVQRRLLAELRPPKRAKDKKEEEKDKQQKGKPDPKAKQQAQKIRSDDTQQVRQRIQTLFQDLIAEEGYHLTRAEKQEIFEQIVADILGFGPLERLLADDATTDIMVVGPGRVFVEREARIQLTAIKFDDEEHLRHIIDRILAPLGRRVDEASPMVDARLPDGSRVNAVIPPVALDGPILTIRKFAAIPYRADDLVRFGTLTEEMVAFLQAAVGTGLNIMVSGGSSSGKTTLLNVLSGYIAHDERIVTIENAAELQLQQDHVVRLETRPANIEGEGEMTIRDLVINSLRMRPDRIIVGEVREGEALDLLQAMNTGHEGSMGTIHANSPSDALVRLETMCLMAGMDIPLRAVREQVAAAIDLVVQMVRLRDGSRKITAIAEVEGLEGDTVMLSSLFEWNQTGLDRDGRAMGYIRPTGITPRCIDQIESAGYRLSPSIFGLTTFDRGRARKTFKPGHEDEHPYELVTAEDQEAAEASAAPPPGQPL